MQSDEVRSFRVGAVLGRGGFGTVYRADLLGLDGFWRAVALKLLHTGSDATGEVARRLRDEARLLGLLRHRAIVQVDGLARLDGRWAVVMEYVEGADLQEVLAYGPMPAGTALEVVQEVAAALQAGFDALGPEGAPLRLLHRDVKPANVVLAPSGEVKLLDYGVARAELSGRVSESRTALFGSMSYMAPERLTSHDSHAGDVYATGVLLVELLTGATLGETPTDAAEHAERVEGALAAVARVDAEPGLQALIREMLAFSPRQRPTAGQVERRARLLRRRFEDPWLSDWAELFVPPLLAARPCLADELSGAVLVDACDTPGPAQRVASPIRRRWGAWPPRAQAAWGAALLAVSLVALALYHGG